MVYYCIRGASSVEPIQSRTHYLNYGRLRIFYPFRKLSIICLRHLWRSEKYNKRIPPLLNWPIVEGTSNHPHISFAFAPAQLTPHWHIPTLTFPVLLHHLTQYVGGCPSVSHRCVSTRRMPACLTKRFADGSRHFPSFFSVLFHYFRSDILYRSNLSSR